MSLHWWCFHEEALASALAAWDARRVTEGATPQQAADDVATIAQFLMSAEARNAKMAGGE